MRKFAILLVAVVALAGCGGGGGGSKAAKPLTKAEYQTTLKQIAKDVAGSLGSTTNSKSISKADVDKLVTALNQFADKLDKVNPPDEVKDLHAQLVATMRLLGDEFPGIADKLRNAKDPSVAIAALFGAPAIQKLAKLQQDFKKLGYDLNLNG